MSSEMVRGCGEILRRRCHASTARRQSVSRNGSRPDWWLTSVIRNGTTGLLKGGSMGSSVPVRDLAGKIVGLRSEKEVDAVQETLDASLKAVGATPTAQKTYPSSMESENPQRPSWRAIATGIAVLSIGVLAIVLFSGRTQAPPRP